MNEAPKFNPGQVAVVNGEFLYIRLPITAPTPSASGKTLVVASTRGNTETDAKVDGKPIVLGVNAYIRR